MYLDIYYAAAALADMEAQRWDKFRHENHIDMVACTVIVCNSRLADLIKPHTTHQDVRITSNTEYLSGLTISGAVVFEGVLTEINPRLINVKQVGYEPHVIGL